MKNFIERPDMETIYRYWGSLEAYQEEQRRTALINMESASEETGRNWNWDFSRRTRRQNRQDLGKSSRSFKLFSR